VAIRGEIRGEIENGMVAESPVAQYVPMTGFGNNIVDF
jgi:hypothetical protein